MDKRAQFRSFKLDADKSDKFILPVTNKNDIIPIVWDKTKNDQELKRKSYEEVLKKRKERFGEVSPPKPKYQKLNRQMADIKILSATELNALKKRKERFGENVSTLMKKLEDKDRMIKRQIRFSTSPLISSPTSIDKQQNEKVFQHYTPVELFKTIDQIEAEKNGKIKLRK